MVSARRRGRRARSAGVPRRQGRARLLVTPRVLVFTRRGGRWLFLEGAPGKWFAGRLNGLGGSVERGEDARAAAVREVREECGLEPRSLRFAAVVHVDAVPAVVLFVFVATLARGEVRPSAEGRLAWLRLAALRDRRIPFLADVRALLPQLAARRPGAAPLLLTARW